MAILLVFPIALNANVHNNTENSTFSLFVAHFFARGYARAKKNLIQLISGEKFVGEKLNWSY